MAWPHTALKFVEEAERAQGARGGALRLGNQHPESRATPFERCQQLSDGLNDLQASRTGG